MQRIDPQIVSKAAKLFNLNEPAKFYKRSHNHSSAEVFRTNTIALKIGVQNSANLLFQLEERIGFARYLHKHSIFSQEFLPSVNKKYIETITSTDADYFAYAWSWIPGNNIENLHPKELKAFYTEWARLIANCHVAAQNYNVVGELNWLDEWQKIYDCLPYPSIKVCFEDLKSKLEHYERSKANYGFIHNDMHPKNLLFCGSALHLIDFDRSCRHYFVQDIANAIYSEYSRIEFHSNYQSALPDMRELFVLPFLHSYLANFPLPTADLKALELFLMYRSIVMFGIFHDEIKAAAPAYLEEFRHNIDNNVPFLPYSIEDIL
ncbi:MAG: phosphotransferase [Candidatus Cloacimonetes bacterium]|jgi:Ser/Thr protein kinase RdoA (MazF antagonist)|nr:phosphotransferase [Candidatus Cloacimonadota bacterium]MDY0298997.1 phosphotransferase [Candidatus Cloacimonadaceae bacterium]MCB5278481.1 phosphotransferase [Candidatus Cloacimonadota bacterium]MCK9333256.1 phosphotransferase [Candidatus Cloacimonadota bacterium]MDD2210057.1 phosphotransferase [Candidatus Cloacimonadota bacterium]